MVGIIVIDIKSLMASAFLLSSAYVIYRASTVSIGSAIIELGFIGALCACMYFSYRLIIVLNRTMGRTL
ncbi:MAG: hypothetical protein A4E28_00642 [Methanocella sp. PtaU1.Bin125]|nr:MAG: hypothetical protein A4E28_00642 [Methanocella sp. PtaU1.Bin125]